MLFGLSRKAATEFSFYLAIPTLIGAGVYSMWKQRGLFVAADVPLFAVGLIFAFGSALICIRWLIRYLSTHDFTVFRVVSHRLWWRHPADGLCRLGRLGTLMEDAESGDRST